MSWRVGRGGGRCTMPPPPRPLLHSAPPPPLQLMVAATMMASAATAAAAARKGRGRAVVGGSNVLEKQRGNGRRGSGDERARARLPSLTLESDRARERARDDAPQRASHAPHQLPARAFLALPRVAWNTTWNSTARAKQRDRTPRRQTPPLPPPSLLPFFSRSPLSSLMADPDAAAEAAALAAARAHPTTHTTHKLWKARCEAFDALGEACRTAGAGPDESIGESDRRGGAERERGRGAGPAARRTCRARSGRTTWILPLLCGGGPRWAGVGEGGLEVGCVPRAFFH